MIYMIGTASISSANTAELSLYFAENENEESAILSAFEKKAADCDTVITYNGTTFDLPFLAKRLKKYGLPDPCSQMSSLDLYRIVKKRKDLLHLPGCRQKDIERFLDIERDDEKSGKELIDIYKQYEKQPTAAAHDLLIGHNSDDVRGMLLLLPILSYEALSTVVLSSPGSEVDESENRYLLKAKMSITIPKPLRHRTDEYYLILEDDTAKCAFPLYDDRNVRYYWDNPNDYVYLIKEKKAVPKSLARTIPKAEKRPALAKECCTSVDVCDKTRPAEAFLCKYLEKLIRNLFR